MKSLYVSHQYFEKIYQTMNLEKLSIWHSDTSAVPSVELSAVGNLLVLPFGRLHAGLIESHLSCYVLQPESITGQPDVLPSSARHFRAFGMCATYRGTRYRVMSEVAVFAHLPEMQEALSILDAEKCFREEVQSGRVTPGGALEFEQVGLAVIAHFDTDYGQPVHRAYCRSLEVAIEAGYIRDPAMLKELLQATPPPRPTGQPADQMGLF